MKRFLPYLIGSLIVHLLLLFFIKLPQKNPLALLEKTSPIWVDLKKGKYEIVDIQRPPVEQKPKESEFLGMYDSSTPQEEVAAVQGRSEKKTRDSRPETRDLKKEEGIFAGKIRETDRQSSLAEPLAEDFFPDFKKGKHTYLNVMRFPEIQYFVRLKRVFKLTFDPLTGLKEAYLNNQITRGKIETVLGVSVDANGNLAEAFVFRSSGVDRYDQEALRTIRASAPFSTPPFKLLDEEGLVRMSWTFTVYL